ncbi:MAG: hypothetical protein LBT80_02185 [Lactobacillaceae bacterium]|jgi:MFS family permease|nr:hypothetical protein [Lactobacillaceae bacterium]
MRKLLKNKAFVTLALSDYTNLFGMTLFNFALIIYISDSANASVWIAVISVLNWVPTMLGVFTGDVADRLKNKVKKYSIIRWIQAVIYIVVALLIIHNATIFIALIIGFNVLSDLLGGIRGGIYNHLLKSNLEDDDFGTAASFSQSMSVLIDFVGGAVGLALLTVVNQNFVIFAVLNALLFVLSGVNVYWRKNSLNEPKQVVKKQVETLRFIDRVKAGLHELNNLPGVRQVLIYIIMVNGIAGSINLLAIISIRNEVSIFGLNFEQKFFLITSLFPIAMFLGSVFVSDIFKKLKFSSILLVHLVVQVLLAISFLLHNGILILILITILGYTLAKIAPRFYGNLMKNLSHNRLGVVYGLLGSLSMMLPPFLIAAFGALVNIVNVDFGWSIFLLLTVALLLPLKGLANKINQYEKGSE